MNKLIVGALLGLGIAQTLVACSDDDNNGGDVDTAGSAGTSGSGTGGSGSNEAGGDGGGAAGKAGSGGSAGSGGTAGKGGGGSGGSAGKGGGVGEGGEAGGGGVSSGLGGDTSGGGDPSGGAGESAGGAPNEPPVTMADTYWLSRYCDAKSIEKLACKNSPPWWDCFSGLYKFTVNVAEDICAGDTEEDLSKTTALTTAMADAAAACPSPTPDGWRCDIDDKPLPKDAACREANQALVKAAQTCTNGE